MVVYHGRYFHHIKQIYVTNNEIVLIEHSFRRHYIERIRGIYDTISTFNNFNVTLSNKFSTVASFVEHNTFNEISGKIFHFYPFTRNVLDSSIHLFLFYGILFYLY